MNKFFKNKKIIFVAVALSLLGYFVFSNFVSAQEFTQIGPKLPTGPDLLPRGAGATAGKAGAVGAIGGTALSFLDAVGKTAEWGIAIYGLLQVLYHLLFWIVTFAYGLLNSAISMALNPGWFQIPAVLTAWQLVRDFVNVWFILIFLFIGIGTILRATNFQAKKLLPTIILMALVVNFSMPVSKFVIDIANIVAFQFLKSICEERTDPQSGFKTCDVSASLENALDVKIFTQVLQELPKNPQQAPTENQPANNSPGANLLVSPTHALEPVTTSIFTGYVIAQAVVATISLLIAGWGAIQTYLGNSSILGVATQNFISILVSDIFLIVTAYVILSLAILFLIRTITLLFLVILSPLGFVMTVVPGTQSYGKMWWDKLITQSFFAPFSLFFLWISIALMKSFKLAMETPQIAPYANYDVSNPANIRLIFYLFSLILLYASLWIARKMGAFGADTLMKWASTARGAVTGFVGGLAARRLVAPFGASMTAAGLPEAIGRVSPFAGVKARDFAEYLSKRGKAPEKALEKAELGMRLAPTERAAYFAKLDRAAKEAMLRKMKGEERNSFISDLGTKNLAAAQEARGILRTSAFAPEERAKTDLDEFKYSYTLPEQWKKFGSLSDNLQKQFLLGIEDADKRAQFLDHVRDEAVEADNYENMTAFQNANTFLEKNSAFSANQQYANRLARLKTEHTEAQKLNNLASVFESKPESEWKTRFRFAMNDSQRLEMIEAWKNDEAKLKKLQGWINEMDPVDQDKFYRDSVGKRASFEATVAFINAVDIKDEEGNKDEGRIYAIRKMILSGASPKQLGSVANQIPDVAPITDDLARTLTGQRSIAYKTAKEKGPTPPPPPAPAPRSIFTKTPLPSSLSNAITNKDAIIIADQINKIVDENLIKEAISRIKKVNDVGLTAEVERRINPIFKVKFMDNILPNKTDTVKMDQYIESLKQTIRDSNPLELKLKITEEVELNPEFQKAFIESVNPEQLFVLDDRSNLINTLKRSVSGDELLKTEVAEYIKQTTNAQDDENIKMMITRDSQTHAEAIMEVFETEFRNSELGHFIAYIRFQPDEALPDQQRWLKEKLFGEE